MHGGNERGFELGWGEENAAIEHFAEELSVALGVRALGAAIVGDRLSCEEQGTERTRGVDLAGNFRGGERTAQAARKAIGFFGDVMVEGVGELLQRGDSSAH